MKHEFGVKQHTNLDATDFEGSDGVQENLSDLNAEDEVEPIDDVLAEQQQEARRAHERSSSFYDEDDGPLNEQLQSIQMQRPDYRAQPYKATYAQREAGGFDAVKQSQAQHRQYLVNGYMNAPLEQANPVRNVQS